MSLNYHCYACGCGVKRSDNEPLTHCPQCGNFYFGRAPLSELPFHPSRSLDAQKLSRKFIGKYMRMAKQVGEDKNPCYSRKIGVVLVRLHPDGDSRVIGTGYNGPPKRTPHCDSREYLEQIVLPQLDEQEKWTACQSLMTKEEQKVYPGLVPVGDSYELPSFFLERATGCQICPRKLIGAKSGERTELCSCEHAEKNAIANAADDLHGAWAFCWCGVACWDCTKLMINAGIKRAFFVDDGSYARNGGADYSFGSRKLFGWAGVDIHVEKPEAYLE